MGQYADHRSIKITTWCLGCARFSGIIYVRKSNFSSLPIVFPYFFECVDIYKAGDLKQWMLHFWVVTKKDQHQRGSGTRWSLRSCTAQIILRNKENSEDLPWVGDSFWAHWNAATFCQALSHISLGKVKRTFWKLLILLTQAGLFAQPSTAAVFALFPGVRSTGIFCYSPLCCIERGIFKIFF